MNDASWETLSNQAVGAAGVVYFLALLAYLGQWAAMRQVSGARAAAGATSASSVAATGAASVAGTGTSSVALLEADADDDERFDKVAFAGRLGLLLTILGCAVHFVALVGRGMAADPNRVPWGNMYEFTISGTFVVTALYLALRRKYDLGWMAPIIVTFTMTFLMVAVLVLYQPITPLSDSLSSYWLVIHVCAAIIATGAFTLGGITSVTYLVKARLGETGLMARVPSLTNLDRISYRIHAFGFPVWTFAVLITGPIWAHQAWSRYWNWDPKEVWAFITWVVYAAYLHARATAGWKGRKAALLAILGLATLWFNFIGINYFSTTSQHSYARSGSVERVLVEQRQVGEGVAGPGSFTT